eukprot:965374-Amphidinium_carterae.1
MMGNTAAGLESSSSSAGCGSSHRPACIASHGSQCNCQECSQLASHVQGFDPHGADYEPADGDVDHNSSSPPWLVDVSAVPWH